MNNEEIFQNWLEKNKEKIETTNSLEIAKEVWDLAKNYTEPIIESLKKKYLEQEKDFIFPLFYWAKDLGFDLEKLVQENEGKTCTELFIKFANRYFLKKEIDAKRFDMNEKLECRICGYEDYMEKYKANFATNQSDQEIIRLECPHCGKRYDLNPYIPKEELENWLEIFKKKDPIIN